MPTLAVEIPSYLSRFFADRIIVWGPFTFYPSSISAAMDANTAIIDDLLRKATRLPTDGDQKHIDAVERFKDEDRV